MFLYFRKQSKEVLLLIYGKSLHIIKKVKECMGNSNLGNLLVIN